jgi:hypothetical protein
MIESSGWRTPALGVLAACALLACPLALSGDEKSPGTSPDQEPAAKSSTIAQKKKVSPEKTPVEARTPPAPGMVWVNTDSKHYHREGDPLFGKTKHGKFLTEEQAKKQGYREAKQPSPKQESPKW